MRKVWEYSLQLRLLQFLCLLLVSLTLLLITSIESNARTVTEEIVPINAQCVITNGTQTIQELSISDFPKSFVLQTGKGTAGFYYRFVLQGDFKRGDVVTYDMPCSWNRPSAYFDERQGTYMTYSDSAVGGTSVHFGYASATNGSVTLAQDSSYISFRVNYPYISPDSGETYTFNISKPTFTITHDIFICDCDVKCTDVNINSSCEDCVNNFSLCQGIEAVEPDIPDDPIVPDVPSDGGVVNSSSWKKVTDFYGYANYKLLNGLGKEAVYFDQNPIANSSDPYRIDPDTNYVSGQEYYLYKFEIPLRFNLGIDERITLDGEIRYPLLLNFASMSGRSDNYYSVLASECELYDSEGKRINCGVSTSDTLTTQGTDKLFGASINMRFDKRFIDKEIYGTLTLYASCSDQSFGYDALPRARLIVQHDSDHIVFIDYNDLKYLIGNYEHKEEVTYQKPGSFVLQEDGTYDWVEGETVTEYVGTEEQSGGIFSMIANLPKTLFDMFLGLIVPSTDEMGELFNRLNDFFAETFGFLYYPFDFIIEAFDIFLTSDSETGVTLPGFSIMGYEVWGDYTYDIQSEPIVGEIFGYVRMGTGALLSMWFVNYLRNFFDKRFGGGGN